MALTSESAGISLGVVLLAAGASSRMGQPKLLLPWGTTTVLGHLLHQWQELKAEQIAVVLAVNNFVLTEELERLNFAAANRIANPAPQRGMFSSIQCAAAWAGWKANLNHWAIVLGDQPHLRKETLGLLLQCAAQHPQKITQPSRAGHRRHPVILPKATFLELRWTPAKTLKQFLQTRTEKLALCEIDDPGLDLDLDWPTDYERALSRWGRTSPQ